MPEDEEEGGEGGTCSAAAVKLLQAPLPFPSSGGGFCFSQARTKGYTRSIAAGGGRLDSAKFRAGGLGIVGGLPQAWPNVSWHCNTIPWTNIKTIQTAELEPI